jgi:hypothetical protein
MNGGGIWVVSWGDGASSCNTLKTTPPISTCDLPWSFTQPRNVLAQVDGSGSGVAILLPAVRSLPINYQPSNTAAWPCCGWPGLVLSNFGGQWSKGSATGSLQLTLLSSLAVSNYGGTFTPWGGIPLEDFGFLKVFATLVPDSTGVVMSGAFQYTLTDPKGNTLYQGGGTLSMRRAI